MSAINLWQGFFNLSEVLARDLLNLRKKNPFGPSEFGKFNAV